MSMTARYDPQSVLPHRGRMILLDTIETWDGLCLVASVTIRRDSLFGGDAGVPAHIGIEYMAQACGAYAGVEAREAGERVRIGFLLGTRNCEIRRDRYRVGERLTVSASLVYRDGQMANFDTRIEIAGESVAEARLTVYQPDMIETEPNP
jgi:predicted hotdog family 3-hydroxylacyl-ACP dehydratase